MNCHARTFWEAPRSTIAYISFGHQIKISVWNNLKSFFSNFWPKCNWLTAIIRSLAVRSETKTKINMVIKIKRRYFLNANLLANTQCCLRMQVAVSMIVVDQTIVTSLCATPKCLELSRRFNDRSSRALCDYASIRTAKIDLLYKNFISPASSVLRWSKPWTWS